MQVRHEIPDDFAAVRRVNLSAFETAEEADLVDSLRPVVTPIVSLVAIAEGDIRGHIFFSPVVMDGHPESSVMGLAPMAVEPGWQRQRIGSALVESGLERCRELGAGAVVVVGHPNYYPRFGFRPGMTLGLQSEYDVPDDVFMAIELVAGYLDAASGLVRFHPAFAGL